MFKLSHQVKVTAPFFPYIFFHLLIILSFITGCSDSSEKSDNSASNSQQTSEISTSPLDRETSQQKVNNKVKIGSSIFVEKLPSEKTSKEIKIEPKRVGDFSTGESIFAEYPTHAAYGKDGTLFLSDNSANKVIGILNKKVIFELKNLNKPLGIGVRENLLYIGNDGRDDVEVYDLNKEKYLYALGQGVGEFSMPNDIVLDRKGNVLIVDSLENRIKLFDSKGTLQLSFGKLGEERGSFRFPVAADFDENQIIVGDQGNHRIQVFDRKGKFLFSFGSEASEKLLSNEEFISKFTRIQAVHLTEKNIFVLDSYHSLIQMFDRKGNSKGFIGRKGYCIDCMNLALDITMSSDGNLLVVDPEKEPKWYALSTKAGWRY